MGAIEGLGPEAGHAGAARRAGAMLSQADRPAGPVTLRGFRDRADYEILAGIRNAAVGQRDGEQMTPIDASVMESLVSRPDRLCIAQVGPAPAGFAFVARAGSPQLDEFGTVEGRSWLLVGPTCAPEWQRRGIEEELLAWLAAYARESGIGKLIKFAKTSGADAPLREMLAQAGFGEAVRYYRMEREMATAPPAPRELPAGLDLIDFRGDQDFDLLWSVLEPAFGYLERDASSYEQTRALFGSMTSDYVPICFEAASGKAVGTIALVQRGRRGQVATFGVIPAFQGRGIGTCLMERALDHAWRAGVRTVDLSVRVENPQAIGIYRRFGFRTVPQGTTVVLQRKL